MQIPSKTPKERQTDTKHFLLSVRVSFAITYQLRIRTTRSMLVGKKRNSKTFWASSLRQVKITTVWGVFRNEIPFELAALFGISHWSEPLFAGKSAPRPKVKLWLRKKQCSPEAKRIINARKARRIYNLGLSSDILVNSISVLEKQTGP